MPVSRRSFLKGFALAIASAAAAAAPSTSVSSLMLPRDYVVSTDVAAEFVAVRGVESSANTLLLFDNNVEVWCDSIGVSVEYRELRRLSKHANLPRTQISISSSLILGNGAPNSRYLLDWICLADKPQSFEKPMDIDRRSAMVYVRDTESREMQAVWRMVDLLPTDVQFNLSTSTPTNEDTAGLSQDATFILNYFEVLPDVAKAIQQTVGNG